MSVPRPSSAPPPVTGGHPPLPPPVVCHWASARAQGPPPAATAHVSGGVRRGQRALCRPPLPCPYLPQLPPLPAQPCPASPACPPLLPCLSLPCRCACPPLPALLPPCFFPHAAPTALPVWPTLPPPAQHSLVLPSSALPGPGAAACLCLLPPCPALPCPCTRVCTRICTHTCAPAPCTPGIEDDEDEAARAGLGSLPGRGGRRQAGVGAGTSPWSGAGDDTGHLGTFRSQGTWAAAAS